METGPWVAEVSPSPCSIRINRALELTSFWLCRDAEEDGKLLLTERRHSNLYSRDIRFLGLVWMQALPTAEERSLGVVRQILMPLRTMWSGRIHLVHPPDASASEARLPVCLGHVTRLHDIACDSGTEQLWHVVRLPGVTHVDKVMPKCVATVDLSGP